MTQAPDGRDKAAENQAPLDWLNFFLADVKDGLGPFLSIFLLSSQHWDAGKIGIVLSVAGIATVIARGPFGALVDAITWKRTLLAISAIAVAIAGVTMAINPQFWTVAVAQAVTGTADAIFPLAITAISLGIVGREGFTRRIGRNEAFNHGGNVVTAVLAGAAGSLINQSAVLWIVAALSVASVWATYRINAREIDHKVARGEGEGDADRGSHGLKELLRNRPLVLFTLAITLFHFANAAMLPLVGQKLALQDQKWSSLFMSACIVVAQAVMVPMALLVGRKADDWGRKPIFLAGFAVLPLRGLLFTLTDNPYASIAVQALDGVGAGIFGALFYIVVADLTKGSGRYNLAQGVSSASWGLGAALSNGVAGLIVNGFGYSAAFLFLAACAVGALALFAFGVPETTDAGAKAQKGKGSPGLAQRAGA